MEMNRCKERPNSWKEFLTVEIKLHFHEIQLSGFWVIMETKQIIMSAFAHV